MKKKLKKGVISAKRKCTKDWNNLDICKSLLWEPVVDYLMRLVFKKTKNTQWGKNVLK